MMRSRVLWCVVAAGVTCGVGRAGLAATRTFPGPAPCNTTLAACLDGAGEGDVVQIATNDPIDAGVTILKSLTLEAAPGFTPQFAAGNQVYVQVYDPARTVVVRGLTLLDGGIEIATSGPANHQVTVTDCHVTQTGSTGSNGINVSTYSPTTVVVERNTIVSNGTPLYLGTYTGSGVVTASISGNTIRKAEVGQSATGIYLDLRGSFVVTANVRSNVISDVADCNCGGAVAIEVSPSDTVSATVNLVNNTIDLSASTGILVLPPAVGQLLAVRVFNNVVTRTHRGIFLPAANPRLTVDNGYNDFFDNTNANVFGGYAAGPGTLAANPLYADLLARDYRLTAGSPLVDAGTDASPPGLSDLDADGNVRIAGAGVDIGAFEFGSAPPTTTSTTSVAGTTTTTTMPPGGCAQEATAASVLCRLAALAQAVTAATSEPLTPPLAALAGKAVEAVQAAEAAATPRLRKKELGRAVKALGAFGKKLRSRKAKALEQSVRDQLAATAAAIRADVKAMRAQ